MKRKNKAPTVIAVEASLDANETHLRQNKYTINRQETQLETYLQPLLSHWKSDLLSHPLDKRTSSLVACCDYLLDEMEDI